jgi:NAD(P)-dependent dehydrogenase (short-subunit alcohol dehydrogenase family)
VSFEGKSVMITGAGKGIGRETARLLASRGASVVALSRTQQDLDSLRDEIGGTMIAVDLADPEAARAAARQGLPADFLVNCAGINVLQSFLDVTVEAFDLVHAVNTRAAMILAQEYARARIAGGGGGGGAIVNVSSISSFIGFDDHTSYCASKGAMDGMSRVMANELGRHGIRVNCINPVVTMTELAARAWSDPARSEPLLSRIPVNRFAEPIDVANVIAFLLSDEAGMLSGLSMPVDGGFLVR